jgi:hypothetical protein
MKQVAFRQLRLLNYALWIFVFARREKHRLSRFSIACPLTRSLLLTHRFPSGYAVHVAAFPARSIQLKPRGSRLSFLCHRARILVFAEAYEDGLSQLIIASPLGELDLRDEFWIYPMHPPHHRRRNSLDPRAALFGWKINKWTGIAFLFAEFLVQDRQ